MGASAPRQVPLDGVSRAGPPRPAAAAMTLRPRRSGLTGALGVSRRPSSLLIAADQGRRRAASTGAVGVGHRVHSGGL